MHRTSLFGVLAVLAKAMIFWPTTGLLGSIFAACTCVLAQAGASDVPSWLIPTGNFAGIAVVVLLFLRYLADKETKDRQAAESRAVNDRQARTAGDAADRQAQEVRDAAQRAWHDQVMQRQAETLKDMKEDHRAALRELTDRLTVAADKETTRMEAVLQAIRCTPPPTNGGSSK